mmetsp:Transcript_6027/g.8530  ORF Transcript_6027/g.8530 Transcript_6027/m.8530 type:complete len:84 (+) Transcript_6027:256-507(+)
MTCGRSRIARVQKPLNSNGAIILVPSSEELNQLYGASLRKPEVFMYLYSSNVQAHLKSNPSPIEQQQFIIQTKCPDDAKWRRK